MQELKPIDNPQQPILINPVNIVKAFEMIGDPTSSH